MLAVVWGRPVAWARRYWLMPSLASREVPGLCTHPRSS